MLDGSDAVADWPLLNALVNTAAGATWVSIHHGGGVGIGYSQHAGMVVVADGTALAAQKLERVLTTDPAMGVLRHVDAGYEHAIEIARERGVHVPMLAERLSRASATAAPADWRVGARQVGDVRLGRRSGVRSRGPSSTGSGIVTRVCTGVISSGTTARNDPIAPIHSAALRLTARRDDPAEDRADRDRAPDDEAHRGVHPALHRRRRDRLAEADLVDVVDDAGEPGQQPGRDQERHGRRLGGDARPAGRSAPSGTSRPMIVRPRPNRALQRLPVNAPNSDPRLPIPKMIPISAGDRPSTRTAYTM